LNTIDFLKRKLITIQTILPDHEKILNIQSIKMNLESLETRQLLAASLIMNKNGIQISGDVYLDGEKAGENWHNYEFVDTNPTGGGSFITTIDGRTVIGYPGAQQETAAQKMKRFR